MAWYLGKFITIDEMMIRYKGTYSPIRQYMPKKPQKWGLKVWCVACSISKFVWNFEIYCGKENGIIPPPLVQPQPMVGDARLAHNVVLRLLDGLWDLGHCVTMDNYFTSIGLFTTLLAKGMYACGTIRANRIGLPLCLKNTSSFKNVPQGTTLWRMHDSGTISCVMWKDKKPVLLLSTHSVPIQAPCEKVVTVPRRNGAVRELIQTSPILLEYTTHMRGVDVADQLRASYSCQVRSHKWWHRIFFFLLDLSVVNMYIYYLNCVQHVNERRRPLTPMTHLQFKKGLCEALLHGWPRKTTHPTDFPPVPPQPAICVPRYSSTRRQCVVCRIQRPHYYCHNCGDKWMCLDRGCYERWHTELHNRRQRRT
jgi:hypothetical protein